MGRHAEPASSVQQATPAMAPVLKAPAPPERSLRRVRRPATPAGPTRCTAVPSPGRAPRARAGRSRVAAAAMGRRGPRVRHALPGTRVMAPVHRRSAALGTFQRPGRSFAPSVARTTNSVRLARAIHVTRARLVRGRAVAPPILTRHARRARLGIVATGTTRRIRAPLEHSAPPGRVLVRTVVLILNTVARCRPMTA